MSSKKIFENHALKLGKLVGNLLSIEMGARLSIVKLDRHAVSKVFTQLPQVKEGDLVEWNAFTNADDLMQTLEKYNKRAPLESKVEVTAIVNLRDALAHGRTFGAGNMKHLRLLKFNRKQREGKVPVDLVQDMTNTWFDENIVMLTQAIEKIRIALDYDKKELT
jgi:hypothetical protein